MKKSCTTSEQNRAAASIQGYVSLKYKNATKRIAFISSFQEKKPSKEHNPERIGRNYIKLLGGTDSEERKWVLSHYATS